MAADLADWMGTALHRVTGFGYGGDDGEMFVANLKDPNAPIPSLLLDEPEATLINNRLSLAQLIAAGESQGLTPGFKAELQRVAWLRAVLMNRWEEAKAEAPLLEPKALREAAMAVGAISDLNERQYRCVVLVMANPGLRPYVMTAMGGFRAGESVEEFNFLRENWWCGPDWQPKEGGLPRWNPSIILAPTFSKPSELKSAAEEQAALAKLTPAQIWFGRKVVDYAKLHPQDQTVPDVLARVVATTRSPACPSPEISAMSREAFRLLHSAYKDTEAAKRTKYYF